MIRDEIRAKVHEGKLWEQFEGVSMRQEALETLADIRDVVNSGKEPWR